jgi:hypothetical protein
MMIAKMQVPPDEAGYSVRLQLYKDTDKQVEEEAQAARQLIVAIIDDVTTPSDNAGLARISFESELQSVRHCEAHRADLSAGARRAMADATQTILAEEFWIDCARNDGNHPLRRNT